ncbi:MAG: hypothetical protein HZB24_02820 [Desulfobacterales bacterium]|nr:hypothetical protein [Desulfobacterales bacterium]
MVIELLAIEAGYPLDKMVSFAEAFRFKIYICNKLRDHKGQQYFHRSSEFWRQAAQHLPAFQWAII